MSDATLRAGSARADPRRRGGRGAVRLGVPQIGCRAAARRGGRLPARRRPATPAGPPGGAGVQGARRPHRAAHLPARLRRHAAEGGHRAGRGRRRAPSGSPASCGCRPTGTPSVDQAVAGDIVAVAGPEGRPDRRDPGHPGAPGAAGAAAHGRPGGLGRGRGRTHADAERLAAALAALVEEDPSLAVRTDAETGQTLLSGLGELHLEVAVEKLRRDHGLEVTVGRPQVAYRETVVRGVSGLRLPARQTGRRRRPVRRTSCSTCGRWPRTASPSVHGHRRPGAAPSTSGRSRPAAGTPWRRARSAATR